MFISKTLFDTNDKIEYLIFNELPGIDGGKFVKIYDEDEHLVFSLDSAGLFNYARSDGTIVNTNEGTKMLLRSYKTDDSGVKIFNLPGNVTSIKKNSTRLKNFNISKSYPNPSKNTARIDYQLPENTNYGIITLFDLNGKVIKKYNIDKNFDHIKISTADIPAGTYIYTLKTDRGISQGQKMVIIK